MTSINEECRVAKAAKAVISALSATTRPTSLAPLHHAYRIAVLHLSNEGPLNEARKNAGIALSTLIHSQRTPEKIDNAKGAVEDWINQLGKV
jgi:hypothetical protein